MAKSIWYMGSNAGYDSRVEYDSFKYNLRRRSKKDVYFTYTSVLDEATIKIINQQADLFIISNAGVYWLSNFPELLNKLSIPIVILGFELKQDMDYTLFIKELINKSSLFAVSSDKQLEQLLKHGTNTDKVFSVPYMETFMFKYNYFNTTNDEMIIGINPTVSNSKLLAGCLHLVSEYELKICLINHNNDKLIEDLKHDFSLALGDNIIVPTDALFPIEDYSSGYLHDIYSKMSVVIGCNKSSVSMAIGNNVPVVGFGEDQNFKSYLWELDILHAKDKEDLIEAVSNAISNKNNIKNNMVEQYEKLSYIKDWFIDQIIKISEWRKI